MGTCLCKKGTGESNEDDNARSNTRRVSGSGYCCTPIAGSSFYEFRVPAYVDQLVLEALSVIGTLVENEQDPPPSMLKLHCIADKEDGWIHVVISMVNVIPIDNSLGPAVITLLLDDCPLPTKESIMKLSSIFNLSAQTSEKDCFYPAHHRNICIVLGCLAEKLAGPSSITILTDGTLDYLIGNLHDGVDSSVILFSLIALEKFAQTSEIKVIINKRLRSEKNNPLLVLEKWANSSNFIKRQVGFCAQWCLDNLFIVDGRKFSYECVDTSGINVMLNTKDVSEYLKISPNGLEARCDAHSFESVRCTFQVNAGVWYYETLVITPGIMQIGWATKDSTFLNHEGYGIGDDEYSLAYDGCRRLIWYNAHNEVQGHKAWNPGDILGCLLDLVNFEIVFYINGVSLQTCKDVFSIARSGFFAAASLMSFQQCKFNFGSQPFKFPPRDKKYESFNTHGSLSPEEKLILPRHIQLEQLRKCSVCEDSCTLCFDNRATISLHPCGHRGFCSTCAVQLAECPMCRSDIQDTCIEGT